MMVYWNFRKILDIDPERDTRCVAINKNGTDRCGHIGYTGRNNLNRAATLLDTMDRTPSLRDCRVILDQLAPLMMCGNPHRKSLQAQRNLVRSWDHAISEFVDNLLEERRKALRPESEKVVSTAQVVEVTTGLVEMKLSVASAFLNQTVPSLSQEKLTLTTPPSTPTPTNTQPTVQEEDPPTCNDKQRTITQFTSVRPKDKGVMSTTEITHSWKGTSETSVLENSQESVGTSSRMQCYGLQTPPDSMRKQDTFGMSTSKGSQFPPETPTKTSTFRNTKSELGESGTSGAQLKDFYRLPEAMAKFGANGLPLQSFDFNFTDPSSTLPKPESKNSFEIYVPGNDKTTFFHDEAPRQKLQAAKDSSTLNNFDVQLNASPKEQIDVAEFGSTPGIDVPLVSGFCSSIAAIEEGNKSFESPVNIAPLLKTLEQQPLPTIKTAARSSSWDPLRRPNQEDFLLINSTFGLQSTLKGSKTYVAASKKQNQILTPTNSPLVFEFGTKYRTPPKTFDFDTWSKLSSTGRIPGDFFATWSLLALDPREATETKDGTTKPLGKSQKSPISRTDNAERSPKFSAFDQPTSKPNPNFMPVNIASNGLQVSDRREEHLHGFSNEYNKADETRLDVLPSEVKNKITVGSKAATERDQVLDKLNHDQHLSLRETSFPVTAKVISTSKSCFKVFNEVETKLSTGRAMPRTDEEDTSVTRKSTDLGQAEHHLLPRAESFGTAIINASQTCHKTQFTKHQKQISGRSISSLEVSENLLGATLFSDHDSNPPTIQKSSIHRKPLAVSHQGNVLARPHEATKEELNSEASRGLLKRERRRLSGKELFRNIQQDCSKFYMAVRRKSHF